MRDVEEFLREARLAAPRDELDRRMDLLFDTEPEPRRRWYCRAVPVWQAALASLALASLVFGVSRAFPGPGTRTTETIYVIRHGSEPARNIFDTVDTSRIVQPSPSGGTRRRLQWSGTWWPEEEAGAGGGAKPEAVVERGGKV